MVKALYGIMIKIDENIPWIELKGKYSTRREAQLAAQKAIEDIGVKIVNVSHDRRQSGAFLTVKTHR